MKEIKFTVLGTPKGKARPKVTMRGGYAHAYTPNDTVEYENYIRLSYAQMVRREDLADCFLKGALRVIVVAYFPIPKSTSKKARERMVSGDIKHTKKPDCDNVAKIILDSLNGIAYSDDSQVCELMVKKLYAEVPRVEIILKEI